MVFIPRWPTYDTVRVSLSPANEPGRYLTDFDRGVVSNGATWLQAPEYFTVVDLGNNQVALRGGRADLYCADDWDGVHCNRNHIHGWEKFTVVRWEQAATESARHGGLEQQPRCFACQRCWNQHWLFNE
jgi:hypothetical protein